MEEMREGRVSTGLLLQPGGSCLWANALTRISGHPRNRETSTLGAEPLGVMKSTDLQILSRRGGPPNQDLERDSLALFLFLSGRWTGRWTCSILVVLRSGRDAGGSTAPGIWVQPPNALRQGFARQGTVARSGDVSVVPTRQGFPLESSGWRPGALLNILRCPLPAKTHLV